MSEAIRLALWSWQRQAGAVCSHPGTSLRRKLSHEFLGILGATAQPQQPVAGWAHSKQEDVRSPETVGVRCLDTFIVPPRRRRPRVSERRLDRPMDLRSVWWLSPDRLPSGELDSSQVDKEVGGARGHTTGCVSGIPMQRVNGITAWGGAWLGVGVEAKRHMAIGVCICVDT
jgi:hypothetical protein